MLFLRKIEATIIVGSVEEIKVSIKGVDLIWHRGLALLPSMIACHMALFLLRFLYLMLLLCAHDDYFPSHFFCVPRLYHFN